MSKTPTTPPQPAQPHPTIGMTLEEAQTALDDWTPHLYHDEEEKIHPAMLCSADSPTGWAVVLTSAGEPATVFLSTEDVAWALDNRKDVIAWRAREQHNTIVLCPNCGQPYGDGHGHTV